MAHSSHQLQKVSWNSIHCTIPYRWQTIVKNHSHLIFEQDLTPILEIRWSRPTAKISADRQIKKVLSRLQKESNGLLVPIDKHVLLKQNHNYQTAAFGHINVTEPAGIVLVCRKCGLLVLAHFFTKSSSALEELDLFFQNLDCHSYLEGNRLWNIQDFSFILPAPFQLDTFSFTFGLSRISFKNKNTYLKLCRLAPASEHLKKVPFTELFSTFSGCAEQYQVINKSTLIFSHTPTFKEKLIARLKRKKTYQWATFTHTAANDRILGAFLESSCPLEQSCIKTIRSSYTIV